MNLLFAYLNWLFEMLKTDIGLYDHWWMWAPMAIPAFCYTIFFLLKWFLVMAPVWIPFSIIFAPLKRLNLKIVPTDKNHKPIDDATLKAIQRWAEKDSREEAMKMAEKEADGD